MKLIVVALCFGFLVAINAQAGPWDDRNDPSPIGDDVKYTLTDLPHKGYLDEKPWSDSYWPSYESGIAHRWALDDPSDFGYKLFSKTELLRMTLGNLKALSPAEKYDIFMQRYDYPTVHSEWVRTHPDDPAWEGLCHGWAPASMAYHQPDYVEIKNADGITIPFGSSDVKALLIYFAAQYSTGDNNEWFVGDRCWNSGGSGCDQDINAGSLHVIFENRLALMKKGFVLDVDEETAVWNQPVYGFVANVSDITSTRTGRIATVDATMYYTKETYPNMKKHDALILEKQYSYSLYVDDTNSVYGGEWPEGAEHPDFAWNSGVPEFHDYFQRLEEIYRMSTGQDGPATLMKMAPSMKTVKAAQPTHVLARHHGFFHGSSRTARSATTWSIVAPDAADYKYVVITIPKISTPRMRGFLKVYEGQAGSGALVAVLHGDDRTLDLSRRTIVVPCTPNQPCGAYVSLNLMYNHSPMEASSFQAYYRFV
mmetsp:Transcript_50306/g.126256  ORF Transcript_50306/g.126256 Transcript_50306/m.126256 type:complete len:481 (-) Transcript_50306:80-1522(-)|eukprot:CAMPEP_0177647988 /NCGR_PEP_ID=MMETSP0447-20121125/10589_1 /TAXON_ID=0 /ORGANISM="Stygamoeba regulata, Strain BSH-02190019" /LENGTH=480 /DNA_ID=CAMNT_0019150601 /DNA_START=138 /DNA_END=1580 /DNA_ORIENTATION=+